MNCSFHPARDLLQIYADEGFPVDCGEPWYREKIELLLNQGPHISAKKPEAIKQLREETMEKVKQGYARVVKWRDIKITTTKT